MSEEIQMAEVPQENSRTSLCHAVRVNDLSAVDKIHEASEELNEPNDYGYTPLLYAAKYGHLDILQKLIIKGAKVDIVIKTEKGNFTILHFLIDQKSIVDINKLKEVVNNLLENKNFKEILDSDNPLLHLACQSGNIAMVEILLAREEFKHEIHLQHPSTKNTPLHEATLSGNAEIVDMLINKISEDELYKALNDKEYYNKDEMSPFHIACRDKHIHIVRQFFHAIKQADKLKNLANSKGKKKKTPLHFACQGGDKEIVELLIKHKAVITSNENGTFPIHVVAKYGHCHLVDEVLGEETVDVVDKHQNTPLNIATRYNKEEMIRKLLDESLKADTAIMSKEIHTPLICAAIRGNTSACKALVSSGALITDTDANGRNIIHIAAEKNNFKFLKEIIESKEKKAYLELINLPDKDLNTPLHLAAERGHVECVKIIISYKEVHLEVENKRKWTPLYCAAERGHHSVIECLLDKSCRFLLPDTDGNTALHLVCKNGHYEATELLLRSQIGFDRRNRAKKTPLDVAANAGHAKVVELLIRTISEGHPEKFLNKLVNPQSQKSKSQNGQLKNSESRKVEKAKSNDTVMEKGSQQETDMSEEEQEVDSPLHLAITQGHLEVVKILVKKEADVKLPNYKTGKTPLQVAMECKHEAIAKEILKDEKNMKEALECKWISKDKTSTTPFKELIKRMPTLARQVLDKASHIQEDPPGHNAFFKFEFTKKDCDEQPDQTSTNNKHCCSSRKKNYDRFIPWKVIGPFASKEVNHPLLVMIESNRKELLEHHFIKHICDHKWFKRGIFAYIAELLFYAVFVIFLTAFALRSPNPQESSCEAIRNGTIEQAKSADFYFNNSRDSNNETRTTLMGLMIPIMFMVIVQIILEIIQFYSNGFWYFKDWTNYLDVVLYISCILFVASATNDCACPTYRQWQIGCIAVFFAWIDLLIFLRMGPGGIHILMFEKIFISFWKTILLTSILVVSFSIVFYMQFFTPGQLYIRSPFSTPGRAHIKVMTMTTGELDFDSLFRLDPNGTPENVVEIPFFEVSIILWILFLIMMPILLSNLLTGLAIDDVKKIRERATMRSLQLKMEFFLNVQELLFSCHCVFLWKRNIKRWEKPDPDEEHSNWWKVYLYIITFFNSDEREDDSIDNSQEEVMESLKKITSNAQEVKKKMAIMESTLKSSVTETMEEIKTLKALVLECSNKEKIMQGKL